MSIWKRFVRWLAAREIASAIDDENWRGHVTQRLTGWPEDISVGRASDIIADLRLSAGILERCSDGQRDGWCHSKYTHFDVYWDDGSKQLDIAELSVFGIFIAY